MPLTSLQTHVLRLLAAGGVAIKRDAVVEGLGERMRLEWVHDSAFRFFPTQRDKLFGYVLRFGSDVA